MILSARVAFVLLMLSGRMVLAQAPAERLDAIEQAYRALDYARVELMARDALADSAAFAPGEQAQLYEILALATFSLNRPEEAREHFEAALRINPGLRLDSLLVSPKIQAFFSEVRAAMQEETPPPPQLVVVHDPRTAAALRSLLAPGWGQLYKGEQAKGGVLLGLWSATAAGSIAGTLIRDDADHARRRATDAARQADEDRRYRRWNSIRNAALVTGAAVWLYAYVDALVGGASPAVARPLQVDPTLAPGAAGVKVRLRL